MKQPVSSRAFCLGVLTPRPTLRTAKLEGHTVAEPGTQARIPYSSYCGLLPQGRQAEGSSFQCLLLEMIMGKTTENVRWSFWMPQNTLHFFASR